MSRGDIRHQDPDARWRQAEAVIRECRVCRLGMVEKDRPYVIPVNFGYRDRTVYIHTGTSGKKLDILAEHPHVCVEFDTGHQLVTGSVPCRWTMHGQSVLATGTASLVEDLPEKRRGLQTIMVQYGGPTEPLPEDLSRVRIIRVDLHTISVRQLGPPTR